MSEKRSLSIIDAFNRVKKRNCSDVTQGDSSNVIVDSTATATNDCGQDSLEKVTISSDPCASAIEVNNAQLDVALQPNSANIRVPIDPHNTHDHMVKSIAFVCYDLLQFHLFQDIGLYIGTNIFKTNPSLAYNLITHNWIPPHSFKFLSVTINGHVRSVCVSSWLSTYSWLSYSNKLEGVICRYCVLFGRTASAYDRASNALGQLVSKPLRSLKDASSHLRGKCFLSTYR